MAAAHLLRGEFKGGKAPCLLNGVKDMVGKFFDGGCAIGQLVYRARHIGGQPARIHSGFSHDELNVDAFRQHKLFDEMDKLDIGVSPQLGRIGGSLERTDGGGIELGHQFLAFETLREPTLPIRRWLHRNVPKSDPSR